MALIKSLRHLRPPLKNSTEIKISTHEALTKIEVNWCCRQPKCLLIVPKKGIIMKNVNLKLAVLGAF
jgi:hypothetical protein